MAHIMHLLERESNGCVHRVPGTGRMYPFGARLGAWTLQTFVTQCLYRAQLITARNFKAFVFMTKL